MRLAAPVPGSIVWLRQRRWRVERARVDRHVVRLDVARNERRLTILAPFDRPEPIARSRRTIRARRQHGLARLAHLLASSQTIHEVRSAVDARIDLWAHQFEPVSSVLNGQRRLLIADEVGLGKTIQAGLILAELRRRGQLRRALVVTPASLREQWTSELGRRFALEVSSAEASGLLDGLRTGRAGNNPWERPGIWIASIDFLKQRHVMDGMPFAAWDVVIVDEAQLAVGRTDRNDACDEIGRRARCLVLLSATPHSGDEARFSQLLRLGALPSAQDKLEIFRRTRADVLLPHGRVVRWRRIAPSMQLARLLDALQGFERAILRRARPARHDTALLLLSVLRKRALSTVAALDRSLARRLEWIDAPARACALDWLQPRLGFDNDDDLNDEERTALVADVGMPSVQERTWLRRLRTLASEALRHDSKVRGLATLVSRASEPVVIFTEFRDSLEHLQRHLAPHRAVAMVHGGQLDHVRQRELVRFTSGAASVLLATDVGGLGLNLQERARWVVNLELPWNPTRLEQRIGRVDRMGQTRRVHATLLTLQHAVEHPVLASLCRRALTAQRTFDPSALMDIAPPRDLVMAAALIDGRSLPDARSTVQTIVPTTVHRRRARALVRVTATRRRLRGLWRGPEITGSRPLRTTTNVARIACRSHRLQPHMLLVFAVPILDEAGDTVERHLVAFTFDRAIDLAGRSAARIALEARTIERIAARIRRLQRLLVGVVQRRVDAQQAIALHLHSLRCPEEAQLGLFSQREARAFSRARVVAALANADVRLWTETERRRARLAPGPPVLEWIGTRR